MFKRLRGLFSRDISVDLGTANTAIYWRGQGIVLHEPSLVSVRHRNNKRIVVSIGTKAKRMLGRTPSGITIIRPLEGGVIADFEATTLMLAHFIQKVHENAVVPPSPRVLVSVPCQSTGVERRTIKQSAEKAGAREVKLIEAPVAVALGAGLPMNEAVGTMTVDIGGGSTKIAVLSLGGLACSKSIRVGGNHFDQAIISHIRRSQGILIGEITAEQVKQYLGSAYPLNDSTSGMQIMGHNLIKGVPDGFELNSEEVHQAFCEPLSRIVEGIKGVLEQTSPDLVSDIGERGIVLAGGGALMKGIDVWLSKELSLPVVITEDPQLCVVRGGGKAWELLEGRQGYGLTPIP